MVRRGRRRRRATGAAQPPPAVRAGDLRLVFAGTPAAAVPSLQAVLAAEGHEVVGVLTRPDAPVGRGREVRPSPVRVAAAAAGVPVLTPTSLRGDAGRAVADQLSAWAPECIPVVAYGALVPPALLTLPRWGWVNLHFSLLPAWRGAAPVQRAVLAGDAITGATTFLLEEGLDTGPVFGVLTEPVRPTDTAGDLLERLAVAGADLLVRTLDGIAAGLLAPQPQPTDGVSLAPKLDVADGYLSFTDSALATDRRSRAVTPAPGAWTRCRGQRLKLGPVRAMRDSVAAPGPEAVPMAPGALAPGALEPGALEPGALEPGAVALASRTGPVLVGTPTGPVALSTVTPAGRGPVPAPDWWRGARLDPADRLGGATPA